MKNVQTTTSTFIITLKNICGYLADRVLVEEKYFPARKQRFTAVYSRDKEYL